VIKMAMPSSRSVEHANAATTPARRGGPLLTSQ
jgi:hypothetical protein